MKKLEVFGATKLKGQIRISGSKNASLPILAATLLSDKKISLTNIPRVKDVETMIKLLESMGSKVKLSKNKNTLVIQNDKKIKTEAGYNLMSTMRAGIIVLGPLLARYGKARVSSPGGCSIGFRPINIHLEALKKMGVQYKMIDGYVHANAKNGLIGAKIKFPKISVGATENLMIAACLAKGQTILSNCAVEPEIKDLSNMHRSEEDGEIVVKAWDAPMEGWDEEHKDSVIIRKEDDKFYLDGYVSYGDFEIQGPFDTYEETLKLAVEEMEAFKEDWDKDLAEGKLLKENIDIEDVRLYIQKELGRAGEQDAGLDAYIDSIQRDFAAGRDAYDDYEMDDYLEDFENYIADKMDL